MVFKNNINMYSINNLKVFNHSLYVGFEMSKMIVIISLKLVINLCLETDIIFQAFIYFTN